MTNLRVQRKVVLGCLKARREASGFWMAITSMVTQPLISAIEIEKHGEIIRLVESVAQRRIGRQAKSLFEGETRE